MKLGYLNVSMSGELSKWVQDLYEFTHQSILGFYFYLLGKGIFNSEKCSLLSIIIQGFDIFNTISTFLFGIDLVLVLLTFENMTNTNTILTVGIVFQYNTSHIDHLCFLVRTAWK
jgi:hypothetical protein